MLKTPQEIIEFVGQDVAAATLGVSRDAIQAALRKGILPALWYDALERLCGRPLDRGLFTFKGRV
jgi:hypothetical protein